MDNREGGGEGRSAGATVNLVPSSAPHAVCPQRGSGRWRPCCSPAHTRKHVTPHTSHVTRHTSHVTRHTSHVTRHTSHVTRHTSHVTRRTSHVRNRTGRINGEQHAPCGPPCGSAGQATEPAATHATMSNVNSVGKKWRTSSRALTSECSGGCLVMRNTMRVTHHTSHVTRHTSHVTRHTSHVTRHTSHITHHTSHVTRHTSHVTRHTSHVTLHTSRATRHTILLQGGGEGGGELLPSEFTRPTCANRLQRQGNPLLGRACTSEWLPPRLQQHRDRTRGRQRTCTMLQEVLGRQQAGTTAALQRSLEQRHSHRGT